MKIVTPPIIANFFVVIKDVISLTAAEYAALSSVDANTLYIVI